MSGKRKYDFQQMKLETSIIALFRMILPEKSFSGTILVILYDPLGQKVNFKVKNDFNIIMCHKLERIIHCFGVILTE